MSPTFIDFPVATVSVSLSVDAVEVFGANTSPLISITKSFFARPATVASNASLKSSSTVVLVFTATASSVGAILSKVFDAGFTVNESNPIAYTSHVVPSFVTVTFLDAVPSPRVFFGKPSVTLVPAAVADVANVHQLQSRLDQSLLMLLLCRM